jgi:hypothetical protein
MSMRWIFIGVMAVLVGVAAAQPVTGHTPATKKAWTPAPRTDNRICPGGCLTIVFNYCEVCLTNSRPSGIVS